MLRGSIGWLLLALLLHGLDLDERVRVVIFVEVCRAEGHLRLPENRLLRMVSHLVILNE